ncbi:MAG: ABC transporter permease [Hyphomicrobiales bacterium]
MAQIDTAGAATQVDQPMLDRSGVPLKIALARATRRSRIRTFMLTVPLIAFVTVFFLLPIGQMLWRSVYNDVVASFLPNVTREIAQWEGKDLPDETVFAALVADMKQARKDKTIGRVATRVNYDLPGTRSLFTRSARQAKNLTEPPYKQALINLDERWGDRALWTTLKRVSNSIGVGFYVASLDLKYNADGEIVSQSKDRQIYLKLFWRTAWLSALITVICLFLAYPVAFMLATLPLRYSNLLMIMVLLPFWTSLLVRTTAWIAILQSQGVLNSLAVWLGIINDEGRMQLIYNQTGTVVAMTHILLPFMVLPLYSVMKTISPTYVRAARSLGANPFTAFVRVYFPQTVPGIAAGTLLVFILAVGYYITPALVGGQSGQLISNFIAFHMQRSLNWSFAAALGALLLGGVLVLYWLYNRLVGINNIKLG